MVPASVIAPDRLHFIVAVVQSDRFGWDGGKSVFDEAAAYLYFVARDHPFLDGNKRTGLECALIHLELNGINLSRVQETPDITQFVVDVAEGRKTIKETSMWLQRLCAMR